MTLKRVSFFLTFLLILGTVVYSSYLKNATAGGEAQSILIQHNGRVKAFDSFARQTLSLITEKERWDKKPAVSFLLENLDKRQTIGELPWIKINYNELKTALGLPRERHFFTYREIEPSLGKIVAFVKESQRKRDEDLRPLMLEQKAEHLYAQLVDVQQLESGETIKVIPPKIGESWLSPYETKGNSAVQFQKMISLYSHDRHHFQHEVVDWTAQVNDLTKQAYQKQILFEVLYNNLRPFEWSWIAYLLAFFIITFCKRLPLVFSLGIASLVLAFSLHTTGLVLRCLVLSRPPVSNMYESMVYMNWVLMTAAVLFSLIRKNWTVLSVGSLISAIIMIYGNLLPIDTSLEVLVPVLRSNYWLTIHVMTIVSSYGIFGLAMGLGHRYLILDTQGKLSRVEAERSAHLINRVIQVGVLLLGIGTVLGGVWANESWGRFWGWDPKETWALITFLGYIIVIHLKHAKVLSTFALALSTIIGFLLVLMTWYGVNFVLGRGLHSYGQGSGGMIWVTAYLLLETLFVGFVLLKKYALSR